MNTYIVMPVANEQETIHDLLLSIRANLPDARILVVVDKFSRDRTWDVVLGLAMCDWHVVPVFYERSTGFASCYLHGFRLAANLGGADAIIEMDAGGSHDPSELGKVADLLEENACAFSTRFARGGGFVDHPWHRRAVSWGGTALANRVFLDTKLSDMTSGFEGFRADVLRAIDRKIGFDNFLSVRPGTGHFFQTEMRYYCSKLRCAEFPITYRGSDSTLKAKTVLRSLAALYELGCRRPLEPGDLA